MKKKIAAAALAVTLGVVTAAPAHAHYDPWTTHWHYVDGQPSYKTCSWWDSLWGCRTEVRNLGPIVLR